ncbi:MAG: YceI family protein [Bacteroidota bacterium]
MIKAIIILSVLFSNGDNTAEKTTYKVDGAASKVAWIGKKVTGEHNGSISLKGGNFTFEDGMLVGGLFTVDMTSSVCEDLEGEYKGKLEGHLKSEDFFGVEKYPTATFVVTKAVPQGPGKYKVIGNITIKEKTEEIQFTADIDEKNGKVTGNANLIIDRSRFDVKYGSGSFFDNLGDKTIYDDFNLNISLVATK